LCVLAVGKMAPAAYKALELMGDEASKITLYDVRVLPPDPSMIDDALTHRRVLSVEDGTRHGGAGTLMVSALRSRAQELARPFPTTRILGTPRAYLEQHRPDQLLAELGLDPEGLAASFSRLLADQPEFAPVLPESPRPIYE
jgi:1-deoxy-D-xylulose-5-phosphate synthase